MKLQIKDGKRIQRERYFPSIATEGPATSVARDISANWDCSKIIYLNGRTEVVYCLKYDNGVSLKVNMNNLRSLLILGGVLISFEIMLNFAQISRFKFNDRLFKYTANPSALLPTILHFFRILHFHWGSPIACCFLVSGTLVHLVLVSFPASSL